MIRRGGRILHDPIDHCRASDLNLVDHIYCMLVIFRVQVISNMGMHSNMYWFFALARSKYVYGTVFTFRYFRKICIGTVFTG
eukprot:SAG11_NODE_6806_length_1244_cov_2.351965_1_plen_82_part_00